MQLIAAPIEDVRAEARGACGTDNDLVPLLDPSGPLGSCLGTVDDALHTAMTTGASEWPGLQLPEETADMRALPLIARREFGTDVHTECAGAESAIVDAVDTPSACGPAQPASALWPAHTLRETGRWEVYKLAFAMGAVASDRAPSDALRIVLNTIQFLRRARQGYTSSIFALACAQGENLLWSVLQSALLDDNTISADTLRASQQWIDRWPRTNAHALLRTTALYYFDANRRDGTTSQAAAAELLSIANAGCPAQAALGSCARSLQASITTEPPITFRRLVLGNGPYADVDTQFALEWYAGLTRRQLEGIELGEIYARLARLLLHLAEKRAEGICPDDADIAPEQLAVQGYGSIIVDAAAAPVFILRGPEITGAVDSTPPAMYFACSPAGDAESEAAQ